MNKFALVVAATLSLSACATDVMRRYVGQPVEAIMVRRGPPANAFDMPDGRRAFQWVISSTYMTPVSVQNSGVAAPVGGSVWWTQNTRITGGQPISNECVYTMYGRWSETQNTWIMVGFEPPRFMCE